MLLEIVAIESAPGVTTQSLAAPFRAPPPPPAFIFGTVPGYLAPDLYSECDFGGVSCHRLSNARLTFDGIILHDDCALWSLALNHPRNHVQAILSAQAANWASLPVRRVAGRAAMIHGPGFDIFGHWLLDFLPRLYVLHRAGLDIATLTFVLPAGLPDFARTYLRLIGIPDANLVWHDQRAELIAPDELVVPSLLRLRSRFHPLFVAATRFWLDRFAAASDLPRAGNTGGLLFISRARLPGARRLHGRGVIEAAAVAAGYEIVFPETLSLAQQICLFRSAGQILGEYGSGLHGSIFAPAGSVICALRGTSHHPGFAQSGLAERFGHHIGYVLGETPEHAGDHAYTIDETAFAHALSAIEVLASDNARLAARNVVETN